MSFGSMKVRPPPAYPGERIGLLGGSFNPAHAGHRQVSLSAVRRLGLSRVWWIVSPGNPLKENGGLAPLASRIERARARAADRRIVVTGFEAALASAFTIATLTFLASRYPRVRFVWLMGADNLAQMPRWREWQSIFALLPIAILDRPGHRLKALGSRAAHRYRSAYVPGSAAMTLYRRRPPAWGVITLPLSPLSSTEIRNKKQRPRAKRRPSALVEQKSKSHA